MAQGRLLPVSILSLIYNSSLNAIYKLAASPLIDTALYYFIIGEWSILLIHQNIP